MSLTMVPGLAVAALLLAALPAAAEWYEGKPDCPPEQVCTMSEGSGGGAEPAQPEPMPYGPDDCVECSGPAGEEPARGNGSEDCVDGCPRADGPDRPVDDGGASGDGSTCMDGAEPWEICDRDVQYLDGREPALEERAAEAPKAVPAFGLLLFGAALAVAGVAALPKRK